MVNRESDIRYIYSVFRLIAYLITQIAYPIKKVVILATCYLISFSIYKNRYNSNTINAISIVPIKTPLTESILFFCRKI